MKELLAAFGPLKAFHLVREPGSLTSKGYAFCEWANADVVDYACTNLTGLQVGDKTLTVKRSVQKEGGGAAAVTPSGMAGVSGLSMGMGGLGMGGLGMGMGGLGMPAGLGMGMGMGMGMGGSPYGAAPAAPSAFPFPPATSAPSFAPPLPPSAPPLPPTPAAPGYPPLPASASAAPPLPTTYFPQPPLPPAPAAAAGSAGAVPTAALRLSNIISPEDVATDQGYAELLEDIRGELGRYGTLVSLHIPRLAGQGLGNVHARYSSSEEASRAAAALGGKTFAGKLVAADFE